MTHLSNGTTVTDIDAIDINDTLTAQGYTIRHIEDWHDHASVIVWDAPDQIDGLALPY